MTVKEHLSLITGPIVIEIKQAENVLYKGYRGCLEYKENAQQMEGLEVTGFQIRVDGVRRTEPEDKHTITELNSGLFNYADLHLELIYVYKTK